MEVWKIIFPSKSVSCRFQPLIFRGVQYGGFDTGHRSGDLGSPFQQCTRESCRLSSKTTHDNYPQSSSRYLGLLASWDNTGGFKYFMLSKEKNSNISLKAWHFPVKHYLSPNLHLNELGNPDGQSLKARTA